MSETMLNSRSERLLRLVLERINEDASEEAVDDLVSAVAAELDTDRDAPFWQLVDRVARMRSLSDRELSIVSDILEVVADHAGRGRRAV